MSDIDDLLARVDASKRELGETIQPPASPEAIERVRRLARETLRTDLPEGYVTFLRRNEGLAFNNCQIYAATECRNPYYRPGFIEVNTLFSASWGSERYVLYGDTGDELYAQDRMSGAWVELDRPSLSLLNTFPSFDAMLAKVLRDALWEP